MTPAQKVHATAWHITVIYLTLNPRRSGDADSTAAAVSFEGTEDEADQHGRTLCEELGCNFERTGHHCYPYYHPDRGSFKLTFVKRRL
jgi:hypothetical protein